MSVPTATTRAAPAAGNRAAVCEWAQVLTGLALTLFILAHLLTLAVILFGARAMTGLEAVYEDIGLTQFGGPAIALLLLVHFVLAARRIPVRSGEQAALWLHARRLRHDDTWLWLVQAATGMVILLLAGTHLWVALTDLPLTAVKSAGRIRGGWWLAFYLVLLPATVVHAAVGIYRLGLKWGLVGRPGRRTLAAAQNIAIALFLLLGAVTLIRFLFVATAGGPA